MVYIVVMMVGCVADQLLKFWVVDNLHVGQLIELIPGLVGITYRKNTGMSFSLLSDHTVMLAVVSVVAVPIIIWLITKKKWFNNFERLCLAIALGGVIGNGIDRVCRGFVVDMIEPLFINFAVFNIADICINIGALMFCISYVVRSFRADWQPPGGSEKR